MVHDTRSRGAEPAHSSRFAARPRDLRWSPDGTRLAFVSAAAITASSAVYDRTAKSLRYLDPSIDLDGNPTWSPDGIAHRVHPHASDRRDLHVRASRAKRSPGRSASPHVATGAAPRSGRHRPAAGSVFQGVTAGAQLQWAAGDRIVFPWERDGWIHLYSVRGRPVARRRC